MVCVSWDSFSEWSWLSEFGPFSRWCWLGLPSHLKGGRINGAAQSVLPEVKICWSFFCLVSYVGKIMKIFISIRITCSALSDDWKSIESRLEWFLSQIPISHFISKPDVQPWCTPYWAQYWSCFNSVIMPLSSRGCCIQIPRNFLCIHMVSGWLHENNYKYCFNILHTSEGL